MGGGNGGVHLSLKKRKMIQDHVEKYRETAMSKGEIIRAIKTVYGFDLNEIEEVVDEVW